MIEYIIVYDYGMGGLWGIIRSNSEAEITIKYPEVQVMDCRPPWMTDEILERIRSHELSETGQPRGWLENVVKERK